VKNIIGCFSGQPKGGGAETAAFRGKRYGKAAPLQILAWFLLRYVIIIFGGFL
jgi:hypothetical protein